MSSKNPSAYVNAKNAYHMNFIPDSDMTAAALAGCFIMSIK